MNLYKISQSVNDDYDTYDSAVVAAASEEEAKTIHPSHYRKWDGEKWVFVYQDGDRGVDFSTSWVLPEYVNVALIGEAKEGTQAGVICASFNAE